MGKRNMRNFRKQMKRLAAGTIAGLMLAGTVFTAMPNNVLANDNMGWREENGTSYWYENGVRQGVKYNADGSIDISYRGKEIYDPSSDAWYWLDSVDNGKKAVSKDVYQESFAGDWGERTDEQGQHIGKWVHYDERGHMVKGWSTNENGTYYFDLVYGTMAKGTVTIDGKKYEFDNITGKFVKEIKDDSGSTGDSGNTEDSGSTGDSESTGDSGNTGKDDVSSKEYTEAVVEELTELKDYRVETGSDSDGELVLPYNNDTADLKKDDILVLPANDAWEDGLILKVTDTYVENGEVRVSGEVPTDRLRCMTMCALIILPRLTQHILHRRRA